MAKTGLVLSGGGVRGLAHIGVLKVLEENDIRFDAIAGCSMGSIIGAFIACGKSSSEIEEFVLKHNMKALTSFSFSKLGIKNNDKLKELVEGFCGVKQFSQLKMPLYVNAVNLSQGREVVFSKGSLFQAIRASSAIPGIFAPVKINNQYHVDGGVLNNTPFTALPKSIKKYIIVDVSPFKEPSLSKKTNIKELMWSSMLATRAEIRRLRYEILDNDSYVLIKPELSVQRIISHPKTFKKLINEGESAAKSKKNLMKKLAEK